ncbi:hypothetical protein HBO10_24565 [Pseudomonas sp. WS 5503]|jgi:hypothetical protein|uniref:hypothetical protein n=1 Tax=Pseudomonas TaxID=286 RepID=UPI0014756444|nr:MULTISPECIES: hypothetical protein [Pseudomonas]NMX82704.1 hypothetical protein [Pseudomonas sp. WS 5503]NNB23723.1 hypothetical protein [Pseudomonas fragi]
MNTLVICQLMSSQSVCAQRGLARLERIDNGLTQQGNIIMRSFIYSLGAVVILLVAMGMQYLSLTYGAVVEGFIRDSFGWISIVLAFISGGTLTALAAGEKP